MPESEEPGPASEGGIPDGVEPGRVAAGETEAAAAPSTASTAELGWAAATTAESTIPQPPTTLPGTSADGNTPAIVAPPPPKRFNSLLKAASAVVAENKAQHLNIARQWRKVLRLTQLGNALAAAGKAKDSVPALTHIKLFDNRPNALRQNGRALVVAALGDPAQSASLKKLLAEAGHDSVCVETSVAAVEFVAASPVVPDIVMLSHELPGDVTCHQAASFLRRRFGPDKLPILLMGPYGESLVAAMTSEFSDYVFMPLMGHDVVGRITVQLRLKEMMRLQSDASLLRRVLPPAIITRMATGQRIADAHPNMTFMFADLCSFTDMCSVTPTSGVIAFLNNLFTTFDRLVDKNNVYKVDIIGDCYFCASGHTPETEQQHARHMLDMCRAMLSAAQSMVLPTPVPEGDEPFPVRLRIGMHSGPAYAGVVGEKTPRYTFFGDTVNTASRMESHGHPMCIHLSDSAYDELIEEGEDPDSLASAGVIYVKGKGKMETFFAKAGDWTAALEKRAAAAEASSASAEAETEAETKASAEAEAGPSQEADGSAPKSLLKRSSSSGTSATPRTVIRIASSGIQWASTAPGTSGAAEELGASAQSDGEDSSPVATAPLSQFNGVKAKRNMSMFNMMPQVGEGEEGEELTARPLAEVVDGDSVNIWALKRKPHRGKSAAHLLPSYRRLEDSEDGSVPSPNVAGESSRRTSQQEPAKVLIAAASRKSMSFSASSVADARPLMRPARSSLVMPSRPSAYEGESGSLMMPRSPPALAVDSLLSPPPPENRLHSPLQPANAVQSPRRPAWRPVLSSALQTPSSPVEEATTALAVEAAHCRVSVQQAAVALKELKIPPRGKLAQQQQRSRPTTTTESSSQACVIC